MGDTRWHCITCNCYFQRKLALEKHYKTRKHKDILEKDSEPNEIFELRKKLEDAEHKVKELLIENKKLKSKLNKVPKGNSYKGNHYDNCIINNIHLNVTLNSFGYENWDYLRDDVINIMKGVHTCIPAMIKRIHFDKEHPENHNIKIPNKKVAQIKTFDGDDWNTHNKKDVIEDLITSFAYKLDEEYGCDFRNNSTQFIQELWDSKIHSINQKIDKELRKQVEYSIIDGQNDLKT